MKKSQIIIATLTLIFVGVILGVVFFFVTYSADDSSLDYMISLQRGPFNFNDTAGDIGCTGPEDIGWSMKDNGDIMIYYGKMIIVVNEQAKKDEQFQYKLKRVGIDIQEKQTEDGKPKYKIKVWDHPIEEWTYVD